MCAPMSAQTGGSWLVRGWTLRRRPAVLPPSCPGYLSQPPGNRFGAALALRAETNWLTVAKFADVVGLEPSPAHAIPRQRRSQRPAAHARRHHQQRTSKS